MNHQFDELSKGLAQSITRRGALTKFGLGLAAFALACIACPPTSPADVITGVTATATSELTGSGFDRAAMHAADGSGLVGDSHVGGEGAVWLSRGVGLTNVVFTTNDTQPAITFNLHGAYQLDSMRVWNYVEPGRETKRAGLQISLNGTDFMSLGEKTFDTAVNPAQNFSFGGVIARFVRLLILENAAGITFPVSVDPTPPDNALVGLAEVQFLGAVTNIGPFPVHLAITWDNRGGCFIRFLGDVGATYRLQRAPTPTGPWTSSPPQTAPASGNVEFWDLFPPSSQAFYRTVSP